MTATAVNGAPPHIQRFSGQSNGQMDAASVSVDRVVASPGRPLEPTLRHDMERRFGHDFSQVRVHTGTVAEQSARDVSADAYAVGHNIVFDAGRFAPGTHQGRRLISHELTHVVQQKIASVSQAGSGIVHRQTSARHDSDWRVAAVQLKWQRDLDEADFVDRLVAIVAHKRGFRGLPRDHIRAVLMLPGVNFFIKHQLLFKTGQQVQLRISASFDHGDLQQIWVQSGEQRSSATSVKPEASSTQTTVIHSQKALPKANETVAERVERQSSETAEFMASQLMRAYDEGLTGASYVIAFNGNEVIPSAHEADTDTRKRESLEVPLAREQVVGVTRRAVDLLVQYGAGKIRYYFSFEGGLHLQRWQRNELAADPGTSAAFEVEAGECDPSDSNYGECLALERMEAYQQGILAAGEMADAYYNPFSGGVGGGGPGPAKMFKLIRQGYKVANTARKLGGRRIKVPKVLEIRSAASSGEKLDDTIKAAAVGYRSSANGSTIESFNRNFAAARIRLETGETAIIQALNVANATHSEEEIFVLINEIKKRGSKVKIEQIFTERMPCVNCMHEIIRKHFGQDVDIFYFIGYSENRAKELRKLYY